MKKKRILMVCEAFGGGVFTYVSQLCNDMVDEFDVYLAYSLRPQTPKNYTDFLDQRVHLIEMENVGVKGLTNLKSDIAAIKRCATRCNSSAFFCCRWFRTTCIQG